jgi:hypothetical protein
MADSKTLDSTEAVVPVVKTPKERLLVALRKGNARGVGALLDQFPAELEPDMAADTAENRLAHRCKAERGRGSHHCVPCRAARYGHAGVVTMLASKCADLSATNKFGMTVSVLTTVISSDKVDLFPPAPRRCTTARCTVARL